MTCDGTTKDEMSCAMSFEDLKTFHVVRKRKEGKRKGLFIDHVIQVVELPHLQYPFPALLELSPENAIAYFIGQI